MKTRRFPALRWRRHWLFAVFILIYMAVSLRHLDVVPVIHEDEPWQASTGWQIAEKGVFGSSMFAGFHGMERRYYGYMPIHPFLLAATYKAAGLGLLQTRLEPVLMGLLTLLLTYALALRLGDAALGNLAVFLLLFARLTAQTESHVSGILLLDTARIARYDMVVPVFGLAALHAGLWAGQADRAARWAIAGLLVGLAGLSHLYGVFWLPALGILALLSGAGWRGLAALAAGALLPWLCYAAYVRADPAAWAAQTYQYGPRFAIFDPAWYWENLRRESQRYDPGLGPAGARSLVRPGWWAALIVLPASLAALARRAFRPNQRLERTIAVPALVVPLCFALLIQLKLPNYLVCVAPIGALAAAWGGIALWRRAAERPPMAGRRWLQALIVATLLAIGVEGAISIARFEAAARVTTPYDTLIARIRGMIPPGARVLGLHRYWLGLDQFDYRSWAVPILLADPETTPEPIAVEAALDAIDPQIIMIDPRMREYLGGGRPNDAKPAAIRRWMADRGYRLRSTLDDPTYGLFEIFGKGP